MGEFTSPAQMRQQLSAFVSDGKFLDKIIVEYFREHKAAPVPVHAPVGGYRLPRDHGAAKQAIVREDETFKAMMANGSRMLGDAIEDLFAGRVPSVPKSLMWRRKSGEEMRIRFSQSGPDGTGFTYEAPKTAKSGPCFKCGAARGCKHLEG